MNDAKSGDPRATLAGWLDADRDRHVAFLQEFARIDTANPPGDTRAGADFLSRALDDAGIAARVIAPQPTMPNLVASIDGATDGRRLVLNGHIDVFPVGERSAWTRDPWSGELIDGRVHGRGTVDMKCGTTASFFTFLYLSRLCDAWPGRLTLTLVSDEETGGRWGSGYLVEHHGEEVLGDCVLNAEPSSLDTVRFGEKGILWLRFEVATQGGHSAYPHLGASATRIATRLVDDLAAIEAMPASLPADVEATLDRPEVHDAIERGLGRGAAEVLRRISINVGTMTGGVKVNMIPERAVLEVDLRLPVGVDADRVMAEVAAIVDRHPGVTCQPMLDATLPPNWCDPDHGMVAHIQRNAEAVSGRRPQPVISLGATDCRFWRTRDVPAYVYGCSPDGMGAPNESVAVDEFLTVLRVHALSALDYLLSG